MSTDRIIQIAMELGLAIAESEQVHTLKGIQTQVLENTEAAALLDSYQEARTQLEHKVQDGLQIVPAEEENLEALQQQLNDNPLIRDLATAQQNLNNLMESVYFVINQAVFNDECEADCSTCGGSCAH